MTPDVTRTRWKMRFHPLTPTLSEILLCHSVQDPRLDPLSCQCQQQQNCHFSTLAENGFWNCFQCVLVSWWAESALCHAKQNKKELVFSKLNIAAVSNMINWSNLQVTSGSDYCSSILTIQILKLAFILPKKTDVKNVLQFGRATFLLHCQNMWDKHNFLLDWLVLNTDFHFSWQKVLVNW